MYKDKTISIQLETLPENPGVYQFYNEKSEILYPYKNNFFKLKIINQLKNQGIIL